MNEETHLCSQAQNRPNHFDNIFLKKVFFESSKIEGKMLIKGDNLKIFWNLCLIPKLYTKDSLIQSRVCNRNSSMNGLTFLFSTDLFALLWNM